MNESDAAALRHWMEGRFDRIDTKVDERTASLAREISEIRNDARPVMEQLSVQLAEIVTTSRQHDREIADINRWRSDDGPLDARLKRHSARHDKHDEWRNTVRGGLIAASIFIPIVTGVTTALIVALVLKFVGAS